MRHLLIFLLSATLFVVNVQAATETTAADGAWGTGATWNSGTPPASNATGGDIITISHNVTLTGGLQVSSSTVLIIDAGFTLTIIGDVTFKNGSDVQIYGTMAITGNLTNVNNSNEIVVDGSISITGDISGGTGSTIMGVGSIDIDGAVTNTGSGLFFGISYKTPDNINGPVTISSAGNTLPIELINWQGDNKNATNHFSWTTASEINNAYFSLERSFDTENWEVIAEINGAGNSSLFIQYEYNDSDYENTINYYRLRQIDFDGNNETFRTIAINNTLNSTLKIVKIVNLMGQEVNNNYTGFRVVMYNDGSRELIKSYPQ